MKPSRPFSGPTIVEPGGRFCSSSVDAAQLQPPNGAIDDFLATCNTKCQGFDEFDLLTFPTIWACKCCNEGTSYVSAAATVLNVYGVVPISNVDGDPHIKTLDGKRYTLLSQGTFSLWHFSGVEAEWKGEVKKVGIESWS